MNEPAAALEQCRRGLVIIQRLSEADPETG
jgi:hypothetical protein